MGFANHAHTRGFRAILRDVRELKDWMVERVEFELTGDFRQRTILKLCRITLAQYRDAEGPDRFCETKTGDAELLC